MRIVDVIAGQTLSRIYTEVLEPAFPPDELVSLEGLRRGVASGTTQVSAVLADDSRILGAAVGDWSRPSRVMLLSYLAVTSDGRGTGIGSRLLTTLVTQWRERYQPCLVLAEVEHPGHHAGNHAHGDPVARLRFYGRHDARVLDLPYFQPALGPGRSRVPGMLLLALWADPQFAGPGGADTVDAGRLRAFLTEYLQESEGRVATDDQTAALWRALDVPGGVPTWPVTEYAKVAVSQPIG
ncbi:GNAT family N-acetyltransferase [Micromonospora sp. NPDC003197]